MSEIKVSVGVFSEASLLGLQMAVFSLHLHMFFPLHISVSQSPLLIRTSVILDEGSPLSPLWRLHLQIQSHSEVLGVRTSTYELGGTQFGSQHLLIGINPDQCRAVMGLDHKLPPASILPCRTISSNATPYLPAPWHHPVALSCSDATKPGWYSCRPMNLQAGCTQNT